MPTMKLSLVLLGTFSLLATTSSIVPLDEKYPIANCKDGETCFQPVVDLNILVIDVSVDSALNAPTSCSETVSVQTSADFRTSTSASTGLSVGVTATLSSTETSTSTIVVTPGTPISSSIISTSFNDTGNGGSSTAFSTIASIATSLAQFSSATSSSVVTTAPSCDQDNCLRAFESGNGQAFCSTFTLPVSIVVALPSYATQRSAIAQISSACTCLNYNSPSKTSTASESIQSPSAGPTSTPLHSTIIITTTSQDTISLTPNTLVVGSTTAIVTSTLPGSTVASTMIASSIFQARSTVAVTSSGNPSQAQSSNVGSSSSLSDHATESSKMLFSKSTLVLATLLSNTYSETIPFAPGATTSSPLSTVTETVPFSTEILELTVVSSSIQEQTSVVVIGSTPTPFETVAATESASSAVVQTAQKSTGIVVSQFSSYAASGGILLSTEFNTITVTSNYTQSLAIAPSPSLGPGFASINTTHQVCNCEPTTVTVAVIYITKCPAFPAALLTTASVPNFSPPGFIGVTSGASAPSRAAVTLLPPLYVSVPSTYKVASTSMTSGTTSGGVRLRSGAFALGIGFLTLVRHFIG